MNRYKFLLNDVNSEDTTVLRTIQVGKHRLQFTFQWAVASDEQLQLVYRYLQTKAMSDPLKDVDGNYNRYYDWFAYYGALIGIDLSKWLDTNPVLPMSVLKQTTKEQQISVLNMYIEEAETLVPILLLYHETVLWQFRTVLDDHEQTTGLLRLGGWFRNQDNTLAFRFTSELEGIEQGDLSNVTIEFEVYDE